jgi:spore maturation protein CgeB
MKILVIGKRGSIVNWIENTAYAFIELGHEVTMFAINGTTTGEKLYNKFTGLLIGGEETAAINRLHKIAAQFKPDLTVFVLISANWLRSDWYQTVRETSPTSVLVGWVGDKFNREQGIFCQHLDHLFCTDTDFIKLVHEHGYTIHTSYLPLAVSLQYFHPMELPRSREIIFVANRTAYREEIVCGAQRPITLYGKTWRKLDNDKLNIHSYRLPLTKLPEIYAKCRAVLNVRNECHVISGLNQRTFEPMACKTPVLNDNMADIEHCFEADKEILVYRNLDELRRWYDRLSTDASFAEKVGVAGYRRIMAEHTYPVRIQSMLDTLDMSSF